MFTGIIEDLGTVVKMEEDQSNIHFHIESNLSAHLKIDQSLSHDGVCLTVVAQDERAHVVTAVKETLQRTSLGAWKVGHLVNLERAMLANARLDGHIVQGHVDLRGNCIAKEEQGGSWEFGFEFPHKDGHLLVDKGSICINGVSLTVVRPVEHQFRVAIIPYTYEHTNFQLLEPGHQVNLEFDIIGKYIGRYFAQYRDHFRAS